MMAATGLPGKPMNGVLFIFPKAIGLPGLIANLQKLIRPLLSNNSETLSIELVEMPPEVIIRSKFLEFCTIFFLVSKKSSLIMPRSNTSQFSFLNNEIRISLFESKI